MTHNEDVFMKVPRLRPLLTAGLLAVGLGIAADAGATGQAPVLIPPRITDATVALIDPESGASGGTAGADTKLAVGDVISFRFSVFPVPDKILRGIGGWLTEYIPSNTEVVGVRFIDAAGNTVEPNLPGVSNDVGATSSIAQAYADTGVFYTLAGDTANGTMVRTPLTSFITLANGSQMTTPVPSNAGIIGPLIGNVSGAYFTHNTWDRFQEGLFGNAGGAAGLGFASPVPSTSSVARYEGNSGTVSPWRRIVYPGSFGWPVGAVRPTPTGNKAARVGQLVDTVGFDVTPLSAASGTALRYALGELRTGIVTQVEVFLRVKPAFATTPQLEPGEGDVNCGEAFGGEVSARNGGTSGGDRLMWPSHVPSPSCVLLSLLFNLDVNKTLALPSDTLTYTINGRNLSTNVTGQQNAQVTLQYDTRLTPVAGTLSAGASAPTACASGYNCVTWSLGTLAPSATYSLTGQFTVSGGNGADSITTFARYTSTQLPGGYVTQSQSMVTSIFTQSAALNYAAGSPAGSAAVMPGGTATITGSLTSTGTNAGSFNTLDLILPTGWTINTGGTAGRVTFTTSGTQNVSCSNTGSHYSCSIPSGIDPPALGGSITFTFGARVPASGAGSTTGLYTIDLETPDGSQTSFGGKSETYFRKLVTVPVTKTRAAAPVVSCNQDPPVPISNGSTTISGTSTEPDGTTVNVYFNGLFRGQASVSGGAWSYTGFVGTFGSLFAGLEVVATAAARGGSQAKLESPKSSPCFVSPVPACADGADNNANGKCDFFGCIVGGVFLPPDPGCDSPADNTEVTNQCNDGVDNNGNGKVDYPADPACYAPWDTTEGSPACSDGVDNDGNGKCDFAGCTIGGVVFAADPSCSNASDPSEWPAPACSDGIDNDGDGKIDFGLGGGNDPGCHSANDNNETDNTVADTKPRMLLVVDTSGSMNWNSCQDVSFTGGDGTLECPGGDVSCSTVAACSPQPSNCGNAEADDSRLFKVKAGVRDAIAGFGEVTYGLMRYHQVPVEFACPTRNATFPSGGWQGASSFPGQLNQPGSCGTFEAGDVLTTFSSDNAYDLLEWVDNQSNFSGTAVVPPGLDFELRGTGTTPLAGSLDSALTYLNGVKAQDAIAACRPYDVILLTDGAESCGGNPPTKAAALAAAGFKVHVIGFAIGDATAQASINAIASSGGTGSAIFVSDSVALSAALANVVQGAVKVELCNGLDDNCNGLVDEGTGAYKECTAANQAIVCGSGVCNQGRCTCTADAQCGTGYACGQGNGTRFCLPSCSVGTLACQRTGVIKACGSQCCVNDGAGTCTPLTAASGAETCNGIDDNCDGVVDNCGDNIPGSCCNCPACATSQGATPQNPLSETCNGCDDDCDGIADNHLTDVGLGCGSGVGACSAGSTSCCQQAGTSPGVCTTDPVTESATHVNNDSLKCIGGRAPSAEVCNGVDDNCNGQTDEVTQACFPFAAPAQAGAGQCVAGTQACNASALPAGDPGCPGGWPAGKACPSAPSYSAVCNGAVGPQVESCNNVDDDCNGVIDDNVTGGPFGTTCCPAGQDCTNQNAGSTRCHPGTIQCQNGLIICGGAVVRSAEVCDGIDNDCNGTTDTDTPGFAKPCTGTGIFTLGICKANFQCPGGIANPSGPRGLTCVQTVPPSPIELCNNLDDNCNGQIDENLMDPALNQRCNDALTPSETSSFPGASIDTLPCLPGHTVCDNGAVVCNGRVGPKKNQCDGVSLDCTGQTNTNGDCPTGFQCAAGTCVQPCSMGEFPCAGGFVCSNGLCIPDGCQNLNCPAGFLCKVDDTGTAQCVDPCVNVNCPNGFRCQLGVCIDDSCSTFGCPEGQKCVGNPPMCQADPCFGVSCATGQYCNGQGQCVVDCAQMCTTGDICLNGECVPDPCKGVRCPSAQVCSIQQGAGVCIDNQCVGGCRDAQTCCNGMCVEDQCRALVCQGGTRCALDTTCTAFCQGSGDHDKIVGAGGGGFSCSYGGAASRETGTGALLLGLLGLVGWVRRRGAARQRPLMI